MPHDKRQVELRESHNEQNFPSHLEPSATSLGSGV